MDSIYGKIKNKRIAVFGVGIMQADLLGLFKFERLQYYICDMVETTGDVMLLDMPCYNSEHLLTENREDLFIIICENDESYAHRKLESMGFVEGKQFCFGEDILFEYAYQRVLPRITRIWGVAGTLAYHREELMPFVHDVRSYIVSSMNDVSPVYKGLPVSSFDDYKGGKDDFILVCSIYYKEIGKQLIKSGLLPGRDFLHVRTFVKLIKYAAFSDSRFQFENRAKQSENLLIILSGYKSLVWESVFPRLRKYVPADFDVVVITSGRVNEELKEMCSAHNWSYVSTERNNVSLAVNLGILLFPEAKYIWKIDEDIIVTEGCFEAMVKTYRHLQQNSRYEIGFVTPLLNVNGYGYVPLLELTNSVGTWERKFGELRVTDCYTHHVAIHDSPEAAMFMWGEGNPALCSLDTVAEELSNIPFRYSICPVRYSIGFIMFSRQDWIRMEMFPVTEKMNLGADEEHICQFCLMHARVIAVAENAVAGHLSYGPQHKAMEDFYRQNRQLFLLRDSGNV
jgi:hypothetical protein